MKLVLVLLCVMVSETWALYNVMVHVEYLPEACEQRRAQMWDFVAVHMMGWGANQQEIESTFQYGRPLEFQLGSGVAMRGVEDAILGMCVGERRRLFVPYPYTLNRRGELNPLVQVGDMVTYSVEIESLSDRPTIRTFNWYDSDQDRKLDQMEVQELVQLTVPAYHRFPYLDRTKAALLFILMHDLDGDGFINDDEYLKVVDGQVYDVMAINAEEPADLGALLSKVRAKTKIGDKSAKISVLPPDEENLKYVRYIDPLPTNKKTVTKKVKVGKSPKFEL